MPLPQPTTEQRMINVLLPIFTLLQPADPTEFKLRLAAVQGNLKCYVDSDASTGSSIRAKVTVPEEHTVSSLKVGTIDPVRPEGVLTRAMLREDKHEVSIKVKGVDHPISCGTFSLFAKVAPGKATETKGDDKTNIDTSLDAAALRWWKNNAVSERAEAIAMMSDTGYGGPLGKRIRRGDQRKFVLVVHLPSGAPASPFPSSVREGTIVQVAVLHPKKGAQAKRSYRLDVESCAAVERFRLDLDADAATQPKVQGALPEEDDLKFELLPVGQWMRCGAGPLEYKLTPGSDDGQGFNEQATSTTQLEVRKVYHLAATAIVGFDTTKLPTFGLNEQTTMGVTTRTVNETSPFAGTRVLLGAQWMIGGVDYEDMRWYNYFANLFVGLDVTKPLDGATFGLALTPTGGASIAVGLSLSKTNRLKNGLQPGATFAGDGDVPVDLNWEEPGVGAFVGLAIDHRIYKALVARFK